MSYTNNPALCIAKWFTSNLGMELEWADLDEDSVIAAANVCDERIRVASGSAVFTPDEEGAVFTGSLALSAGARVLDYGDGVRVTTTGTLPGGFSVDTTYYVIPSDSASIKLATSVANALAGTFVTPTSSGSGTQTILYYDEARYKLNGTYAMDTAKGEVLKQLLSAMAGYAVYIGGKWFLHAGAPAVPTVTLTEDDLRGPMQTTPKRSLRDRFNGVRAVYVNPDANWQPVDAPPMQNATYLAEDGEELYEDLRFPFTISTRAVQRLMKIALESNRRQMIVQFPAKLTAMRLQPLDGVYLTIERYGWNQKQFRVMGWVLTEDGGVDLTLQEDDSGVYAWDSSEEQDTAIQQGVVLPDPSTIAAPAAVTVDTPTTPTYTRVVASWDAVPSVWNGGYDVEYRDADVVPWTGYGRVGADDTNVAREVTVERTTPQDFRVRAVTRNGSTSSFTENLAPDAPTNLTSDSFESQLTLDADVDVNTVEIQIFEHATNDFVNSTLLATITPAQLPWSHTGLGADETHYYWFRAINAGGNISAQSATLTGTTLPASP